MNPKNYWAAVCATLGPIGWLPAPGTWGTLIGFAIGVLLANQPWYPFFVLGFCAVSWFVVAKALPFFSTKDPNQIVLDEVAGALLTFVLIPFSLPAFIFGFLFFRMFDITKLAGVGYFERYGGATGILLDDFWAALIAGLLVRALFWWNLL